MTEVNTTLVHCHTMQNDGKIMPQLEFWQVLAKGMLVENTIGQDPNSPERLVKSSRYPKKFRCKLVILAHYLDTYNNTKKKFKKCKQHYQKHCCINFKSCNKMTHTYCRCSIRAFLCIGCFTNYCIVKVVNVLVKNKFVINIFVF